MRLKVAVKKMVVDNNSSDSNNTNRNGRSRGPSPNGSTNSSDDDYTNKNGTNKASKHRNEFGENKIRVGKEYQTTCPDMIPECERSPEEMIHRALLVWSPTKDIPDVELDRYIAVAKERYGYNGEQALGMLFWHKHDLDRALTDLNNFTPFPDEWTDEDKMLFHQAFQVHGKSFHRIRQMLPDKSIASLVKYYYTYKKPPKSIGISQRQLKQKLNNGNNMDEIQYIEDDMDMDMETMISN